MALRGKNARQLGAYSRRGSSNQRHTIGHPTSSLVRVLVTQPCRRYSGLRGLLTAIVQFSSGALSLGRCSFSKLSFHGLSLLRMRTTLCLRRGSSFVVSSLVGISV